LFEDNMNLASAHEGANQYAIDMANTAPTFILQVDEAFIAVIMRGDHRIDFKKIKSMSNSKKVLFATQEQIQLMTDANIGYVSLINPSLETWIDNSILEKSIVYGGCGIKNITLKISTQDLCRITNAKIVDVHK
jgi:prolyl-tRNA editing enzyme YbaK/EbsC (Cys-tRNA(Pro) deacylase)